MKLETAPDTKKSSAITDHVFAPRPSNPYLCNFRGCGLAEAAHERTTVKR